MDRFDKSGLSELIDKTLGIRGITAIYSYSDMVKNLMAIYLCCGEAIEDVNGRLNGWKHPPCSFMSQNIVTAQIVILFNFNMFNGDLHKSAAINLSYNNKYWEIKTAEPRNTSDIIKRKLLWKK